MNADDARQAVKEDGLVMSIMGASSWMPPAFYHYLASKYAICSNEAKLLFDSGVRSGLDVARALASGADFVLLGRAFMFGLACLGAKAAIMLQISSKTSWKTQWFSWALQR